VTPDTAVLPNNIRWVPTSACSPRHGHPITLAVVHRWGDKFTNVEDEEATYLGNVNWFRDPAHQASAHLVYPGSSVPDGLVPLNECTQMVAWKPDYAWTEAAYNPACVEVESADAIWLGQDADGLLQLARIIAYLLLDNGLPPVWSSSRGFCRHGDLGAAGGGHLDCPTGDMALWRRFVGMVQYQHARGGFRPLHSWGR
jgi:hypothetical protein